jgi:hypothetical protein
MSRTVYIEAVSFEDLQPGGRSGSRFLAVELNMTKAQIKRAIVDMLSEGWGESEAFEWFASEFPEWVAPATLPQWVKDAAEVPA